MGPIFGNPETLLDLNHILLFVVLASPVVLLWRLQRLQRARPAGWAEV